ncbi:MAG: dethiobiotin synthase [Chromatiales bacterium]|nr:dethiobiotin synthase [Chromatiales bacterium]
MGAGVFITGTDTGVGKTIIACRLIESLEASGVEVAVRKPVESGCVAGKDGLIAADADSLAAASASPSNSSLQVCCYRYKAATSPARAALLAGETLYIEQLVACSRSDAQLTMVEGAGGLLSPIATDGLNIDLIEALGFSVIVVSSDQLGSINHALLTLEALAARRLKVIAVVLNRLNQQTYGCDLDNYRELNALVEVPIVQVYKDNIASSALSELTTLITNTILVD